MGDGRHGLAGIRERALLLGGETMVSSGEKGVAIRVNIPIATAQEATCS
jgi:signal transduction histidine kinase